MKFIRSVVYILLSIIVLDQFFFNYLIWKLPNESAWNTNHFFNFIYEYRRIKQTPKSKPRILFIGSSISYYSTDKELLENYLKEKTGNQYDVEYFSYAGMTPLDAYLTFDKIVDLKPDLIVFPINFIDLRLHRAYVLDPKNQNSSIDEKILLVDALDFLEAQQSKYAFSWEALTAFYPYLNLNQNAKYLASTLFFFYRYREIYLKNLQHLYNHRFGRNTSYHGYAGVQIPERINSLGWTGEKFSFYPLSYMQKQGFYIQIVPEILLKGKLVVTITNKNGFKQVEKFASSGWKRIQLKSEFIQQKSLVTASLSNTWIPYEAKEDRFDHSKDMLGVRLQQTFGLEKPENGQQYTRVERLEDLRYIGMNDSDYENYFYFRLLDDLEHRPGIAYLHALKDAKIRVAREPFVPTLHLKYLKMFSELSNKNKIKLLVINNPENPISLSWYEQSNWYEDHINYLRGLDSRYCKFVDLRNHLKMQDFSDYHHFTYPGMVKMTPIYGNLIADFSQNDKN
ncbi:MAG: hypothetical protein H7A23_19965 [Leptospiraceae bacterium]|nr:hypothetical protein [Leptospiraceae bacterium]MCP5496834.1 hypothetical protein [Leptospiraceae bacterium]